MKKIEVLGKYDLNKHTWNLSPDYVISNSLSVINYNPLINIEEENKYDYIIYCKGSKLESHNKNKYNINNNITHVEDILRYFKGKKNNIIIKYILLDPDAPLNEDIKILVNYITQLCARKDCNSINILACSKGGVISFNLIKYINPIFYKKINLYNVATPYEGTMMASPKLVEEAINTFMKLPLINHLEDFGHQALTKIYESICSNSHMDYDIGLLNENLSDKYDETLIKNLFQEENIRAINSINRFKNYVTEIDNTTLKRAILTGNINGIGLCFLNEHIMNKESDGFVHAWSQNAISKYIDMDGKQIILSGSHHDVMSDYLYYSPILFDIYDNLLEDKEKIYTRKRKI